MYAIRSYYALRYFGEELVLFRTRSGTARVLDPFCPHLGAHLGVGGTVEGGTLRCPFHGWRFDGSGTCVEIPYASRIPPRARIARQISAEQSGLVLVWYDEAGRPPFFAIPELPEWHDERWSKRWIRYEFV